MFRFAADDVTRPMELARILNRRVALLHRGEERVGEVGRLRERCAVRVERAAERVRRELKVRVAGDREKVHAVEEVDALGRGVRAERDGLIHGLCLFYRGVAVGDRELLGHLAHLFLREDREVGLRRDERDSFRELFRFRNRGPERGKARRTDRHEARSDAERLEALGHLRLHRLGFAADLVDRLLDLAHHPRGEILRREEKA